MADVFLSYAREDEAAAKQLAEGVRDAGSKSGGIAILPSSVAGRWHLVPGAGAPNRWTSAGLRWDWDMTVRPVQRPHWIVLLFAFLTILRLFGG